MSDEAGSSAQRTVPSRGSGLLYGLGLGGFVDGIVFHQILQWHHMVSDVEQYPMTTVAGLEVNTLADGFFHAATWLLVLAASVTALTAWRQGRLGPRLPGLRHPADPRRVDAAQARPVPDATTCGHTHPPWHRRR